MKSHPNNSYWNGNGLPHSQIGCIYWSGIVLPLFQIRCVYWNGNYIPPNPDSSFLIKIAGAYTVRMKSVSILTNTHVHKRERVVTEQFTIWDTDLMRIAQTSESKLSRNSSQVGHWPLIRQRKLWKAEMYTWDTLHVQSLHMKIKHWMQYND